MDDNYTESLSLKNISAKFGYNKTYFSRIFNQYIGMSLTDYINMVRYDNFEKLYKNNPESNVTTLALECGFSSLATFYRVRNERNKWKSNINSQLLQRFHDLNIKITATRKLISDSGIFVYEIINKSPQMA